MMDRLLFACTALHCRVMILQELTILATDESTLNRVLFNMMEDKVLRYWLQLVIDDDGSMRDHGFGATVDAKLAIFYADDGLLSSADNA
jgi:hypothetical protein